MQRLNFAAESEAWIRNTTFDGRWQVESITKCCFKLGGSSCTIALTFARDRRRIVSKGIRDTLSIVPYRGSAPAMQDLMAEQINLMVDCAD